MNILQTIFNDHYEEMLYILHPRQAVIADLTQWQATGVPLTEFFPTHPGFSFISYPSLFYSSILQRHF